MRPGGAGAWLAAAVAAWAGAGCAVPVMAPLDLAEPGWRVREAEVVWRPSAKAPELLGELSVARHVDGRHWVQFGKQGLPWLTARRGPSGWTLETSMRRGVSGGRGQPPARVPWFLLDDVPPSRPPAGSPWRLEASGPPPGTGWRLVNESTGEVVEGNIP